MSESNVGILHPGAMGVSFGAALKVNNTVYWVSEGRSPESVARAEESGLNDAGTLAEICKICDVLVSICPPHGAEALAEDVIATGFKGLYCDANAIAPERAKRIGQKLNSAGIDFVDGSIIGPPAWKEGQTRLYLSGKSSQEVAELFANSLVTACVVGDEIGKASALKMVFAALTKGTTALLSASMAAAEALGVRDDLEQEWAMRDPQSVESNRKSVQQVTQKAWRFAGEMEEIATTFADAGLPDEFHIACNIVYGRMAGFKGADQLPDLADVLKSLIQSDN